MPIYSAVIRKVEMQRVIEMAAQMQEIAETDRKTYQDILGRTEANQEYMKEMAARMEIDQAKTDAILEEKRREIQSGQAEMRSTVSAIEKKLDESMEKRDDGGISGVQGENGIRSGKPRGP
jgi:SMC interacting uncharacterized protein involved in chromosome segregation